jgi:hypothetical protein
VLSPGFGSASKLRDFDDWQDPRISTTDDDLISPYSDSSANDLEQLQPQELSKSGTYVIRRGRKKERKLLPKLPSKSREGVVAETGLTGSRRFSNTFDNIKSLLKESSKLEGLSEPPAELASSTQAVSQPDLGNFELRNPDPVHCPEHLTSALKVTNFAERIQECNGFGFSDTSSGKGLEVSRVVTLEVEELPVRRIVGEQPHLESKIPVNLLIEDQIVKKALNENRRQLEKVSDAIKEIENVKNSGEYGEGNSWRNGEAKTPGTKRNSFEDDGCERRLLDVNLYEGRQPRKLPAQTSAHANDATDGARTAPTPTSDHEFDRRRINGADIYASGRRSRAADLESHKNDTKQIENVIDAILEDSKNPDFQVIVSLDLHYRQPHPHSHSYLNLLQSIVTPTKRKNFEQK